MAARDNGPFDLCLLFETPGEPGTVLDPRAEGAVYATLQEAVQIGSRRSYESELERHQLIVRLYTAVAGHAELDRLLDQWEARSAQTGMTLVAARIMQADGWYEEAALRLFEE